MPRYDFTCQDGHTHEADASADDKVRSCPRCGRAAERQFPTAVAFHGMTSARSTDEQDRWGHHGLWGAGDETPAQREVRGLLASGAIPAGRLRTTALAYMRGSELAQRVEMPGEREGFERGLRRVAAETGRRAAGAPDIRRLPNGKATVRRVRRESIATPTGQEHRAVVSYADA